MRLKASRQIMGRGLNYGKSVGTAPIAAERHCEHQFGWAVWPRHVAAGSAGRDATLFQRSRIVTALRFHIADGFVM